jgi:hypothetical protein
MGVFPLASKFREPNESGVFTDLLPDGAKGTQKTIEYAKKLIAKGLMNPDVRRLAVWFCRAYSVPSYDEPGEVRAQFQGVLDNFFYRKHLVGGQLLQHVSGILETLSGDCADLTLVLLPSLLGSIGYPSKAVTIKCDADRPDEFSHVYIETQLSDGRWIPLDVARQDAVFGRAPEYNWGREEYPLTAGVSDMNNQVVARRHAFPRFGLGQDDDDDTSFDPNILASSLVSNAPSIISATAQLVKATNTPGLPYSGAQMAVPYTAPVASSSSTIWLILLALGIGAIAIASKG